MSDDGKRMGISELRFWDKVDRTAGSDGCWVWRGSVNSGGYGVFWTGKQSLAHRISWEIHFGPRPDGLFVLHRCDNPPCVNPAHLFLGTVGDNNADRKAKGRSVSHNARKTHCLKGHELAGDNISLFQGRRQCRVCARAAKRRYDATHREEKNARNRDYFRRRRERRALAGESA